ncbi:hypothetical protein [Lysobacter capsici]|uniref:hypothetical protein n=1 Tax=Lysobacter capsici TaxID=435897 RepID=UPI00287B6941|nr:hypothetical protein [Lysobacter capsici]WND81122.1 hypothetical protein RJ610_01720 [Lysobacter capsici]WND86318.1 hypothetical protein RJ609_01720 [Lysobacter capsici]
MSEHFLTVNRLERVLTRGGGEAFDLEMGVNLLIGRPNTGKTKWLQTLDFLLGDSGDNPYVDDDDLAEDISEKYSAAKAHISIGGEALVIERRWKEPGSKGKVFVNDEAYETGDFQRFLLEKLGIPLLNFPKGNPMSGQTWPHLSFRILLRHIYRQQRFWSGIADQQSENEQHAALLQLLGIAEKVFTADYGELVKLKLEVEKLKARRQQHSEALKDLALEVLSEPELTVEVNEQSVVDASSRLEKKQEALLSQRRELLTSSLLSLQAGQRGIAQTLGDQRAALLSRLEDLQRSLLGHTERFDEMNRYADSLRDELDRMERASDAGHLLADLKVTHCPACDQTVKPSSVPDDECFLCHQQLPDEPRFEELGAVRLRFERDRILSDKKEAQDLISVIGDEISELRKEVVRGTEDLRSINNKLAPVRESVSAIAQDAVSAIDMQLGEFSERQRHLKRIGDAVNSGKRLTEEITRIEGEIAPLKERVDESIRSADFDLAATRLEDGMNAYLSAINSLRPDVWKHSAVNVTITRSVLDFRVGSRRWNKALGGTDTLYFLMAYHYGLLTLSAVAGCHYPGLSIIDLPGEFSGESIADIENFVVQPFIDLVSKEEYEGAQVIITGPSFSGLAGVHRVNFSHVYAAR